ncbi:hypothetical protein J6590_021383 [Homalodisca vitripennis]|nr:hypothetical protein J6590_021383 [Homalodisca vitripennis]
MVIAAIIRPLTSRLGKANKNTANQCFYSWLIWWRLFDENNFRRQFATTGYFRFSEPTERWNEP